MKPSTKTIVTFGLISGGLSSVMMLLTVPFLDRIGFEYGEYFGYTAIVASFLPVYFGIRAYRENVGGGTLTFGRGFFVGLMIAVISSLFYVATWQVVYFKLVPDFGDKYQAYALERLKKEGASQQKVDEMVTQMESFKRLLGNPLTNAAITLIEPLPIGLLIAVISAGVLRKKPALQR
jgi:uncharacterized protein DUF4199